jgi:two-component system, NtrC family, sensor kinase
LRLILATGSLDENPSDPAGCRDLCAVSQSDPDIRTKVTHGRFRCSTEPLAREVGGHFRGGDTMARTTINILMALTAVVLLGALVLLSTASSDAQRRLDQSLRHVRDITHAIERELVNMRNLNIDSRTQLGAMADGLAATLTQTAADVEAGYPASPDLTRVVRRRLMQGFNAIGDANLNMVAPERVLREFQAVRRQGGQLSAQVLEYGQQHMAFRETHEAIAQESRDFVRELRERRLTPAADQIFRTTQQVLQGIERGAAADLLHADEALAHGVQADALGSSDDQYRLRELMDELARLASMRRQLDQRFETVISSQFARQVEGLRDLIGRDHVYHLSTLNDSRVLLNLYTIALLLVLGYFGMRLQRSYRALNDSHLALETMNASLEERVQARTVDLKQAYEKLKESQVQLVQAEKMSSLGQLVAGIMHEINTPLLYVLNNQSTTADSINELQGLIASAGRVATVLKNAEASSAELDQALAALRDQIDAETAAELIEEVEVLTRDNQDGLQQISELVQSLKDFSRLDRAKEDSFDVREGIEKTLTITHNLWKYGVEVVREFDDVPEILCSPSKINQVCINLITNAVQAMDGKGTLTVRTRHEGDWVALEVEDTGCGIPAENLARIMDPFFTTKPVGQGTGLGMSIVQKIVDDHAGRVDVHSEVGVGTRFTIRLPIRRDTAAEAA